LAPAVMQLLGDRSWWLPAPLARVLPAARAG
jgi:RND superfamily putative drug exporter